MRQILRTAALLLAIVGASPALARDTASTPEQYKPYEFLIGSWDFAVVGQPRTGVMDFQWGPNRSYIRYGARMVDPTGALVPHFEGIIVWNGLHENLDTLVMLDMERGRTQEAGTFKIQPDGSVVREIFSTSSASANAPAAVGHFLNTFTPAGGTIKLALRRELKDRTWQPIFPGADNIVLTPSKDSPPQG